MAALSSFQFPINFRTFVVQSGSMEPAIPTGSLVFVQSQPAYAVGEVITYSPEPLQANQTPETTITHRLIGTNEVASQTVFFTKGDANSVQDLDPIPEEQVIGKVTTFLPYLGYPVGFIKTQLGFILLIIVPATIIVYSELVVLKKEIVKMLAQKKAKNVANTKVSGT